MPSPLMLWHFLLETFSRELLPRVPEPALLMDDLDQARAYAGQGGEQGFLAPFFLYHAIQASALIRPGDKVLDLACGPGNQLRVHACLTASAYFTGVDAAPAMLALGRQGLAEFSNVDLHLGCMQALAGIPDASIDVVSCTMSLHHLADEADLLRCLCEIRRVLKPEGRVYLADFGRLKRRQTLNYLAQQHGKQPEVFREDYFNSLRAAFSVEELSRAAWAVFGEEVELKQTHDVPLFVALISRQRAPLHEEQRAVARRIYKAMALPQRLAFRDMARFFRQGGFPLAFEPW